MQPNELLMNLGEGVESVEIPRYVNRTLCTIVTVRDLQTAKRIQKEFSIDGVKVCLHPHSFCLKRPERAVDVVWPSARWPNTN